MLPNIVSLNLAFGRKSFKHAGCKLGAHFEGDDKGYIPTMKEKIFSLLLFMGFMGFVTCIVFLLKATHIILQT